MKSKDNSQNSKENSSAMNSKIDVKVDSQSSMGEAQDYISGDSTPSSSGHQFPWIATNPKKESKKSAMKTN